MAVRLDETERVAHGRRGHRRDGFGGAGDVDDDARLDGTGPDRRGMLVSGADDDRATPPGDRTPRRRRAAACRPPRSTGAPARTSTGPDRLPRTDESSKSPRVTSYTIVDDAFAASWACDAGQVVQQIRPDGRERRRTLPDRGFVVADPHHLRCTVRGIRHQTRPLGEHFLTDRGDQTVALLGGALVQPDDRRA